MKFLALAALAVVAVSAEACTEDELANEETPKCDVTTTEGEGDDAVETVTCTDVEEGVTECDEVEEEGDEEEEEASSALFAGVASAAVAATMMF